MVALSTIRAQRPTVTLSPLMLQTSSEQEDILVLQEDILNETLSPVRPLSGIEVFRIVTHVKQ